MKLIADSGSTKTDWVLLDDKGVVFEKKTRGYNPNHSGVDVLEDIVKNEKITIKDEYWNKVRAVLLAIVIILVLLHKFKNCNTSHNEENICCNNYK